MFESLIRFFLSLINIFEFIVFTCFMYLLSFLPGTHNSQFYFLLFQYWCRAFVRALGLKIQLHQKNQKPIPGHFILISNHPSAVEDIAVPALYPVHSLAKIQVKDWFIVGRINHAAGTLYVDRDDEDSRKNAVQNMLNEAAEGKNIALYPEGGCFGRRITKEFKRGAFELSIKSGLPIVPILIYYQAQEDFEWQPPFTLIDKLWHFITSANKTVEVFQFDAIDPKLFKDKYELSEHFQQFYFDKQSKYLE